MSVINHTGCIGGLIVPFVEGFAYATFLTQGPYPGRLAKMLSTFHAIFTHPLHFPAKFIQRPERAHCARALLRAALSVNSSPAARGNKEAGFTQPRAKVIAGPCKKLKWNFLVRKRYMGPTRFNWKNPHEDLSSRQTTYKMIPYKSHLPHS